MGQIEIIQEHLKQAADQTYYLGVALELVGGLLLGLAIGYQLGSSKTIVILLEQGIET
jgi:F0F1-type ATP synthase assembly protein I